MKRVLGIALSGFLLLSLSGCSDRGYDPSLEPIVASYYDGQNDRAYKMLHKSIFKKFLSGWTDDGIENPVYRYDTFARYEIVSPDAASAGSGETLYYCAFTADQGKFGYVVLSYNRDGLSKISVAETPYLYDLRENIDVIAAELSKTELDLSSSKATRVLLTDDNQNHLNEAILITDSQGHRALCCFREETVMLSETTD